MSASPPSTPSAPEAWAGPHRHRRLWRRMPRAPCSPAQRLRSAGRRGAPHRTSRRRCTAEGGRIICYQILHAGRYASTPIASRPPPQGADRAAHAPRALDEAEDIEKQIADIIAAAVRAREAGYDGVEIMGSGRLPDQPVPRAADQPAGGSPGAGRGRTGRGLAMEVVRRVREATGPRLHPDLPHLARRPRRGRPELGRGACALPAPSSRGRRRRCSTAASAGTRRGSRPSRPPCRGRPSPG
jgi:hypothetical protein